MILQVTKNGGGVLMVTSDDKIVGTPELVIISSSRVDDIFTATRSNRSNQSAHRRLGWSQQTTDILTAILLNRSQRCDPETLYKKYSNSSETGVFSARHLISRCCP